MGRLSRIEDRISAVEKMGGDITPVGAIVARISGYFTDAVNGGFFVVPVTLADNWRLCDGSECIVEKSPIFNASGRHLPNLTDDRFLSGSTTPGEIGGANSTILSSSNLPPHTHSITHDHGQHNHTGTTGTESAVHTHFDSGHSHSYGGQYQSGGSLGAQGTTNYTNWYATTVSYANLGYQSANHTHSFTTGKTDVSFTGESGDGGYNNSAIENRPKYLTVQYYIRIY